MQEWLTGLPDGAPAGREATRTVVVEDASLVPALVASGLLDVHSRLIVRSSGGQPSLVGPAVAASYRGTLATTDSQADFDNGYQLATRHYGAAEFLSYDVQTVLRITDADDFSAYLRDADRTWTTGRFPDHLTHPHVIIADLASLGGRPDHSGPYQRLFVFPDASVSTSPTGARLGSTADGIATLDRRWRAANETSQFPDAVPLDQVVGDRDRSAALLERTWVRRYLIAIGVIRLVREEHRLTDRVSGFGGRISDSLPEPTGPDPDDAPVLLRIGRTHQAHDPVTGLGLAISGASRAMIESLLAHPDGGEAAEWCVVHLGIAARQLPGHLTGTLRLLADAGVAARWSDEAALQWGHGPPGRSAGRSAGATAPAHPTSTRRPVPSGPP
jgi:hypothetical protein